MSSLDMGTYGFDIDWALFAARVPVPVQVRQQENIIRDGLYEYGILLENAPNDAMDKAAMLRAWDVERGQESKEHHYETYPQLLVQLFEGSWLYGPFQPEPLQPQFLEYLIGGQWLTFGQVMEEDI